MSRTLLVLGLSFFLVALPFKIGWGSNEPSETKGLIQEVPDGPPLIDSVDIAALPEPEAKQDPCLGMVILKVILWTVLHIRSSRLGLDSKRPGLRAGTVVSSMVG